jgi:type IV pilus assembly protein PilX
MCGNNFIMTVNNSSQALLALHSGRPAAQQGVILIVALVMLLVMTSLGVTTMSGSILQERIANNSRQQFVARSNAEAAMRSAESFLDNLSGGSGSDMQYNDFVLSFADDSVNPGTPAAIPGFYFRQTLNFLPPLPLLPAVAPVLLSDQGDMSNSGSWLLGSNSNSNSIDATTSPFPVTLGANGLGVNNPHYVIEYLGCSAPFCETASGVYYSFRILAIGWGNNPNAYSVLQALYLTKQ